VRLSGRGGGLHAEWDIAPGGKEYVITSSHHTQEPPSLPAQYPLDGDRYTELRWRAELTGTGSCGLWLLEYDEHTLLKSST